RKKAIEIKASVKLISACEEHKKAYEDSKGGEFTKTLLRVWDEGRFRGNYDEFHKRINKKIKKSQRPQLVPLGPVLSDFDNCKPFKI
ncbi:MAG: caspase family protein, partial [Cyclobacteriaceae bacterium]